MVQVHILEQPTKEIRFRYKSERRQKSDDDDDDENSRTTTAGIPGINSQSLDKKTYPSIVIQGYHGWATIRVSCVVDADENGKYRPHPHELAGPNCKQGFFEEWLKITDDNFVKAFDKLSIRCARRKDVMETLELRRKNKVDPFKTGRMPGKDLKNINLAAVRLCFEVFIHGCGSLRPLEPLVSEVILDKKKLSKLKISYCSHTSAPVTGADTKIVLLCDKIFPKEMKVVFFEKGPTGETEWENIVCSDFIFQHVAVVVKVPPYRDPQSLLDHDVSISLWDPSGETRSTLSYPFRYTGIQTDPAHRPPEDLELVTYNTRYGPMLTRKRAKRMYWIPPELFKTQPKYNFQSTSRGAGTEIPTTTAEPEPMNSAERGSPAMVDRFYSVPGTNPDNRPLHRESSCPDYYMTGSSSAILTTSFQHYSVQTENTVDINQEMNQNQACFVQTPFCFETKTEDESVYPANSFSQYANSKCTSSENMDTYNFASTSTTDDQTFVPGTSLLPSLFPASSVNLPNSSNETFGGLPSMDELMSHLRNVQDEEENVQVPGESCPEFVNSPNIPNFDHII